MTVLSNTAGPTRRGRPPRAPQDSDVRTRLVRAGLIHLTEKGYSAVGVDEVLQTAGVPKGSFYHYFASKSEFATHLIDAYHAYFLAKLDRFLLDETLQPLQRLEAFARDAEEGMARHEFRRGCLVGNLGQEMGALPEPFRECLTRVLEDWQIRTAACLRLGQDRGAVDTAHSAEKLANWFWIGWEGAVLRAKLERNAVPLRTFTDIFFTLISTRKETPDV